MYFYGLKQNIQLSQAVFMKKKKKKESWGQFSLPYT